LDSLGYEIIPARFDTLMYQRNIDGIIAVKNDKYGLFTRSGEEIASCVYDPIKNYYQLPGSSKKRRTITVQKNGKTGLINIDLRREVIPCEYVNVGAFAPYFYQGLYIVRRYNHTTREHLSGLFDSTGKMILPCEYDHIADRLNGNLLRAGKNKKNWHFQY
jgi:hypothetical protein